MKQYKVSVVITFFNSEKTIEKIIKDCVNQTLKSKEIVLINNGSYDSSLEIAEKYAKQYDFIKIINQKNMGVAGGRDAGLRHSSGEYVTWWDSDDSVESTALEILYNRAKADKADIVCSQIYFDFVSKKTRKKSKNPFPSHSITGKEALENLLRTVFKSTHKNNFVIGTIWDKMIRRELILEHNIAFRSYIFEDIVFVADVLVKAKKVSFVNNYFYTNYQHLESFSSTIKILKSTLDALNKIKEMLEKEDLMSKYNDLYDAFYLQLLFFVSFKQMYTIVDNIKDKKIYIAYKKKLISVLDEIKNSEDFKTVYKDNKISKLGKIQFIPRLFVLAWLINSRFYINLSIIIYKLFI